MPIRPCGVTELISPSKLELTTTRTGEHGTTLPNEVCVSAANKLGGVLDSSGMGARKVESDLRKILKMHKFMPAVDLALSTSAKLGTFIMRTC